MISSFAPVIAEPNEQDAFSQYKNLVDLLQIQNKTLREAEFIYSQIESHPYIKKFFGENISDKSAALQLCKNMSVQFFKKGDVIMAQGDQSDNKLYVILEGKVGIIINFKGPKPPEGAIYDIELEEKQEKERQEIQDEMNEKEGLTESQYKIKQQKKQKKEQIQVGKYVPFGEDPAMQKRSDVNSYLRDQIENKQSILTPKVKEAPKKQKIINESSFSKAFALSEQQGQIDLPIPNENDNNSPILSSSPSNQHQKLQLQKSIESRRDAIPSFADSPRMSSMCETPRNKKNIQEQLEKKYAQQIESFGTKVNEIGKGTGFGDKALLAPTPKQAVRNATIITTTPVLCIIIFRKDFLRVVENFSKEAIFKEKTITREFKFFKEVSSTSLKERLLYYFSDVRLLKHDYLCKEDDEGDGFYVLAEGKVNISKKLQDPSNIYYSKYQCINLCTIERPTFFCEEIVVCKEQKYKYTIQVISQNAHLFYCSKQNFSKFPKDAAEELSTFFKARDHSYSVLFEHGKDVQMNNDQFKKKNEKSLQENVHNLNFQQNKDLFNQMNNSSIDYQVKKAIPILIDQFENQQNQAEMSPKIKLDEDYDPTLNAFCSKVDIIMKKNIEERELVKKIMIQKKVRTDKRSFKQKQSKLRFNKQSESFRLSQDEENNTSGGDEYQQEQQLQQSENDNELGIDSEEKIKLLRKMFSKGNKINFNDVNLNLFYENQDEVYKDTDINLLLDIRKPKRANINKYLHKKPVEQVDRPEIYKDKSPNYNSSRNTLLLNSPKNSMNSPTNQHNRRNSDASKLEFSNFEADELKTPPPEETKKYYNNNKQNLNQDELDIGYLEQFKKQQYFYMVRKGAIKIPFNLDSPKIDLKQRILNKISKRKNKNKNINNNNNFQDNFGNSQYSFCTISQQQTQREYQQNQNEQQSQDQDNYDLDQSDYTCQYFSQNEENLQTDRSEKLNQLMDPLSSKQPYFQRQIQIENKYAQIKLDLKSKKSSVLNNQKSLQINEKDGLSSITPLNKSSSKKQQLSHLLVATDENKLKSIQSKSNNSSPKVSYYSNQAMMEGGFPSISNTPQPKNQVRVSLQIQTSQQNQGNLNSPKNQMISSPLNKIVSSPKNNNNSNNNNNLGNCSQSTINNFSNSQVPSSMNGVISKNNIDNSSRSGFQRSSLTIRSEAKITQQQIQQQQQQQQQLNKTPSQQVIVNPKMMKGSNTVANLLGTTIQLKSKKDYQCYFTETSSNVDDNDPNNINNNNNNFVGNPNNFSIKQFQNQSKQNSTSLSKQSKEDEQSSINSNYNRASKLIKNTFPNNNNHNLKIFDEPNTPTKRYNSEQQQQQEIDYFYKKNFQSTKLTPQNSNNTIKQLFVTPINPILNQQDKNPLSSTFANNNNNSPQSKCPPLNLNISNNQKNKNIISQDISQQSPTPINLSQNTKGRHSEIDRIKLNKTLYEKSHLLSNSMKKIQSQDSVRQATLTKSISHQLPHLNHSVISQQSQQQQQINIQQQQQQQQQINLQQQQQQQLQNNTENIQYQNSNSQLPQLFNTPKNNSFHGNNGGIKLIHSQSIYATNNNNQSNQDFPSSLNSQQFGKQNSQLSNEGNNSLQQMQQTNGLTSQTKDTLTNTNNLFFGTSYPLKQQQQQQQQQYSQTTDQFVYPDDLKQKNGMILDQQDKIIERMTKNQNTLQSKQKLRAQTFSTNYCKQAEYNVLDTDQLLSLNSNNFTFNNHLKKVFSHRQKIFKADNHLKPANLNHNKPIDLKDLKCSPYFSTNHQNSHIK